MGGNGGKWGEMGGNGGKWGGGTGEVAGMAHGTWAVEGCGGTWLRKMEHKWDEKGVEYPFFTVLFAPFFRGSKIFPPIPFVGISPVHSLTEKWDFLPLSPTLTATAAGVEACQRLRNCAGRYFRASALVRVCRKQSSASGSYRQWGTVCLDVRAGVGPELAGSNWTQVSVDLSAPDPAWSDEPTQVHRVTEDSVPPPPSSGVTPALDDEELEVNIFGQKVTKTGPTCSADLRPAEGR